MSIVSNITSIKLMDDSSDSMIQSVKIEIEDSSSGSFATASISITGTPTGVGSFVVESVTSDRVFEFDQTTSIVDIYQSIDTFINSHPADANFSSTFDSNGVYLTAKHKYASINGSDLGARFLQSSGLSFNITPPSGGVDPTPTGFLDIGFDGSYSTRNIHQTYEAQVLSDRSAFAGKMRSELTLPTPTEVVTDYDANGNVTQVQLLF